MKLTICYECNKLSIGEKSYQRLKPDSNCEHNIVKEVQVNSFLGLAREYLINYKMFDWQERLKQLNSFDAQKFSGHSIKRKLYFDEINSIYELVGKIKFNDYYKKLQDWDKGYHRIKGTDKPLTTNLIMRRQYKNGRKKTNIRSSRIQTTATSTTRADILTNKSNTADCRNGGCD